MTLYEIDSAIAALADPETGDILDFEALDKLQMERETKIENIALWYKNLTAEATAIKAEVDSLAERKQAAEAKAERLKKYLDYALDGTKFSTARCQVSFRKTSSLEIDDEPGLIEWAESNGHDDCVKYRKPEIKKKDFTGLIKSGVNVPYTKIIEGRSLAVK